ncbi:MAG: smalltalk protein [Bacteroidaceae bacterium]|nr:smalltalk protein [Bacteroidaceae bacterium]
MQNKANVSFDWGSFLKVLIAVLTALAGALGVASCVN